MDDCILNILYLLDVCDLLTVSECDKLCNKLSKTNSLWVRLFNKKFTGIELKCESYEKYRCIYKLDRFMLFHLKTSIMGVYNMKTLDLSNKKLTSIPSELGELKNLRVLNLSNNNLVSIPFELYNLKCCRLNT